MGEVSKIENSVFTPTQGKPIEIEKLKRWTYNNLKHRKSRGHRSMKDSVFEHYLQLAKNKKISGEITTATSYADERPVECQVSFYLSYPDWCLLEKSIEWRTLVSLLDTCQIQLCPSEHPGPG